MSSQIKSTVLVEVLIIYFNSGFAMKINWVNPPIRKWKATIYCDDESQAFGNGTLDYSEDKAK